MRIFCVILCCATALKGTGSTSAGLLNDLLNTNTYNARLMPADNATGAVTVTVDVVIERIHALDDKTQELWWVGYVLVRWQNPHLSWDPVSYEGQTTIYLQEADMWVPDICILERLDAEIGFKDQKRRRIKVWSTGDILWVLGGDLVVTRCPLNVKKFPFDTQSCSMSIGSYVMPKTEIHLKNGNMSEWDGIGGLNSIWAVTGWSSRIKTLDIGEGFDYLLFTVHLSRMYSYHVINIVLPCLLMSLLMGAVFLLPSEGGEKMGFSITLLLAFNVMQLVITDNIPKTSEVTPVISIFISGLMGLSALTIPLSILVIHVSNNGIRNWPKWIQKRLSEGNKTTPKTTPTKEDGIIYVLGESEKSVELNSDLDLVRPHSAKKSASLRKRKYSVNSLRNERKEDENPAEQFRRVSKHLDYFLFKAFNIALLLLTLICMIMVSV